MVDQRAASPQELHPVSERLSFLYVERATVSREGNALTVATGRGVAHVPVATIATVLLGPGTTVTHGAVALMADSGTSLLWVGEQGVRYYAHGTSQARSTRLLERQAELVSSRRSRLAVARRMYEMRFPDEDVSRLTMQQLRGREGARVRAAYRREARRWGIEWSSRRYDRADWSSASPVNRALSAAYACLYGVCHAAAVALGCAPGLGFIHTGHARAFVFDVADLYKAETSIPVAFEAAADGDQQLETRVRRMMRDVMRQQHLLERAVRDITRLLGTDTDEEALEAELLGLWDDEDLVPAGTLYLPGGESG